MNKLEIRSPLNDEILGEIEMMTKEEVNDIYIKARKSFENWKNLSSQKRKEYLYKAANLLEERKEYIANLMTKEISKSYKDSLQEIERTVHLIKYTAEEGLRITGELINGSNYSDGNRKISIVEKIPKGVILSIAPFNYPINLSASKIAPALISGNVVVFKPPTQGALSAKELYNCFIDADIPKGVLQIVTGKGSEIGNYLNTHKEIDFINFTGSTEIGKKIGIQAGMKPILLELGGKDAAIVLKDANLLKAAKEIVSGAYSYSGQRCTAIKRVIVDNEVADTLVKYLKEEVSKLTVGNPFNNVDIVPLIDKKAADYIEMLYNDAISKGSKSLFEFKREDNLIYPILLDYVNLDTKIAWEEPFGPILPIIRANNENEMLEIANSSEYGLQSSVFTQDIDKAIFFSNKLEVGTVHINSKTQRGPDNLPFLGIKNSGVGIQGIRDSILSMMTIKTIVINI